MLTTWKVGSHVPFSGKISTSLQFGINVGCYATQFFIGSPQSLKRTAITQEDVDETNKLLSRYPTSVFSHFPYVANFAGSVKALGWDEHHITQPTLKQALKSLQYELDTICALKGERTGVVIHPGSFPDTTAGLDAVVKSINSLSFKKNQCLLLENCAGEGTKLCKNLKEISYVLKNIKEKKNVKVCIDTCHIFASGEYDFSSVEEIDRFFIDFEEIIGLEKLQLFHLNDSIIKFAGKKDEHARLGTGYIWGNNFTGLIYLLNRCKKLGIPAVLETTPHDMETLAHLCTGSCDSPLGGRPQEHHNKDDSPSITEKKLAIVGSREFKDYDKFKKHVQTYFEKNGVPNRIISGGAVGTDTLAEHLATEMKIPVTVFKPEYDKFPGKVAPLKRNTTIVENSTEMLAFVTDSSKGTLDSIQKAKNKGIPCTVVKI